MKKILITFAALAVVSLSGCSKGNRGGVTGVVDNGRYTNPYFGISFEIPGGWEYSRPEYGDSTVGDVDPSSEGFNPGDLISAVLIMVNPPYADELDIPGVILIAERVVTDRSVTAQDYLRDVAAQTPLTGNYLEEYAPVWTEYIGERAFAVLDLKDADTMRGNRQRMYTYFEKPFALTYILTYRTDEDFADLDSFVQTIEYW